MQSQRCLLKSLSCPTRSAKTIETQAVFSGLVVLQDENYHLFIEAWLASQNL